MRVLFAAVLSFSLGACSSAIYSGSTSDSVTVYTGIGGLLKPILSRYDGWAKAGKRLRIAGPMVSADAFGAFGYKGDWCYTEDAVFQGHAISNLGLYRLERWTERSAARLPAALEAAFRADMAFHDIYGMTEWDVHKLRQLIPEYECRDEDV